MRQQIALMVVNVILIIELCVTMYFGSRDPENLTPIFLQSFFGVMIPTFIIGKIIVGRMRSKVTDADYTAQTDGAETTAAAEAARPAYQMAGLDVAEATRHYRAQTAAVAALEKKRRLAGKLAAVLLILLFLSLLDSCVARMRQPINVLQLLPGTSTQINGPVDGKIKGVSDLTYISTSEHMTLKFTDTYQGFWFGGTEWSGTLTLSPAIQPGEYRLTVMTVGKKSDKPPLYFQIFVHRDALGLQQTSKSLIELFSGIHPWWVVAVVFPLTGALFGSVYLLARRSESVMARGGTAEVYWKKAAAAGTEIAFGLGTDHGVKTGCIAAIFDEQGHYIGAAEVLKATVTDATAIVGEGVEVKMGYTVVIIQH